MHSPKTRTLTVSRLTPHSLLEEHVYSPLIDDRGQLLTTNAAGAGPDGVMITGGDESPPLALQ